MQALASPQVGFVSRSETCSSTVVMKPFSSSFVLFLQRAAFDLTRPPQSWMADDNSTGGSGGLTLLMPSLAYLVNGGKKGALNIAVWRASTTNTASCPGNPCSRRH